MYTALNNKGGTMWVVIKGFKDYEVSTNGLIRKIKNQKELKTYTTSNGYVGIKLVGTDGRKGLRVHRLVAEAFLPNPDNKPFINHIDGNKFNNAVENLEWVTTAENNQHAYDTGLKCQDDKKVMSREQVAEIRRVFLKGCRINGGNALGRKYGVSKTTILKALNLDY